MAANNQITAPRVEFLDQNGKISREWYMFLYNLYALVGTGTGVIPVTSGGTGVTTIPTNGQLLIGNGTGYTLNTLGTGSGISVANGAGTITVANTGVLSFSGGTTGLTPVAAAVGVVVLGGTLIAANGGTGFASYAVGDLLYANTTTTLAKLADVATGNALISGGVSTAPAWGKIGLTTHVDGVLPIANGGTNATATPIAGAVAYGTGTAYAFTASGSAGQVLTSAGAGVPIWTTNAGGDVTGPASSTDNAVARFDSTTGKLIQNSTVIIDDTGATTGVTTLAASTSVTTPIVQASNSGGLSLKNSAGTTQLSMGAGGGDNLSLNVSTNINGANAQIDISPTGTGHVHIKPSGAGSVEVAPTNVGTIDNMTIGATTPKNASVVDLSVTGTTSFDGSQGTAGQVLTSAGTGATPTWTTPTTGTVTSVTGTSPVASSGGNTPAISLAASYGDTQNPYASKTANFVLAAPNGTAGVPTFRAVVAADIPTLNQNTTGTASNVTGTVAIANGGTGETTRQNAMDALAGAVTSGQYLRGNGTDVVMSAIQAADVPTLNQNTTGTAANVTGTVAIANGGTGQTTATAAFNALAPSQTSNSGKYLTTDGTNSSWATVSVNGPAFSAYAGSVTSLTNGTYVKVLFDTETFDTNNNFASSRFTPTVTGYYQVNCGVSFASFQSTETILAVYKNGSIYQYLSDTVTTRIYTFSGGTLIYCNGSTDYIEIYVLQSSGGSVNTVTGAQNTQFSGSMVRGA